MSVSEDFVDGTENNIDSENSASMTNTKGVPYRSRSLADMDALEREIATIEDERRNLRENPAPASVDDEDDNVPDSDLDAEERTFKKRYGDLRRHAEETRRQYETRIRELETRVNERVNEQVRLPKSEEELAEFMDEYPDVAAVIETIAAKKAQETRQSLDERLVELERARKGLALERAFNTVIQKHPDFPQLRRTDDFQDWLQKQPKWAYDALYSDDQPDANSAIRVIDLYKADKGLSMKKPDASSKRKDAELAAAATTRGNTVEPPKKNEKPKLRESEIMHWTPAEVERRMDELTAAQREGRIVYDISGGAR